MDGRDRLTATASLFLGGICAGQGWFVAFPILLSVVGLVMLSIGGFSCEMFILELDGYVSFKFGYTGVDFLGGCVEYTTRDASLGAGYAFAILATIFGCVTALGTILTAFVRLPRWAVTALSISAFAVAAFGGVVCGVAFAVSDCQADGSVCLPSSMAYVAMVGTLAWISAGSTLCYVPKHERESVAVSGVTAGASAGAAVAPKDQDADEEAATCVSTVVNPDGTKTRTTTVTRYEGGQKIVDRVTETA
jgi:hypothetical protein